MLLLVVAGVLLFTSNVAPSDDCSAEGTFCLQGNMDNTYSYQVPSGSSAEAALSIVIKRRELVERYCTHEWTMNISSRIQELKRGSISFIPEAQRLGKLMLTFITMQQVLMKDQCYEWKGDLKPMSRENCGALFQRDIVELPHYSRFITTDQFDKLIGFEGQKMHVQIDLAYVTQSESKQISIRTKEAFRLFMPKDFVATAADTDPGKTDKAKNSTPSANGITPKSAKETPEREDKPKKGGVDPFVIAGLVALICVLAIAVAVVSYLAYSRVKSEASIRLTTHASWR